MTKTYKSKLSGLSIYVDINGSMVYVGFKKGFVFSSMRGCTFTTDDKDMQKAIESHKDFNRLFWTDDKEQAPVEEQAALPLESDNLVEKKVKRYTPKK